MEIVIALLHAVIAAVTYRILKGRMRPVRRVLASAFWPLTLATVAGIGLLILPLAVLALIGHAISWYRRTRSLRAQAFVIAFLAAALAACGDPTGLPEALGVPWTM
jgi:hypothetical protein